MKIDTEPDMNLLQQLMHDAEQRDALGYERIFFNSELFVCICPTCKALVKDWKGHQEWHEKLALSSEETETIDAEFDNI